ncbi:MAG TPA: 50S ribosomal protein L13 [Candidatus Kapabacteria bacterium]|nr:50S ribosomal protein L13 [Candidatus Kapabacteria bacterium]
MEPSAKFTKSFRKEDVQREWWIVDASDMTVGRVSTQIATLLRGKHKAIFTPHVDTGDFVIVINADKVKMEGKRVDMKEYFSHSGYPGGVRIDKFKDLINSNPAKIIEHSVKGMLPKNRLGRQIVKKLKVYAGGEHPHTAQQPKNYELQYK